MNVSRGKHVAAPGAALGIAFVLFFSGCPGGGQVDQDAGTDAGDAGTDAGDAGADAGDAGAGDVLSFTATLTAAQEVPPTNATGTGTGEFTFFFDGGTLAYTITHDQQGVGEGHIHRGHAAVNGPVIHPFSNVTSPITGAFVLADGATGQDFQDLLNGRLYVNLHAPGGTPFLIRGQILLPGEKLYSAQLNDLLLGITDGGAGGAAFVLSSDGGTLRWDVTLTTLDGGDVPSAAHIHNKTTTGVIFPTPGIGVDGGSGSGTAAAAVVTELEANNTYFNVHTPAMGSGRVQGELKKQ